SNGLELVFNVKVCRPGRRVIKLFSGEIDRLPSKIEPDKVFHLRLDVGCTSRDTQPVDRLGCDVDFDAIYGRFRNVDQRRRNEEASKNRVKGEELLVPVIIVESRYIELYPSVCQRQLGTNLIGGELFLLDGPDRRVEQIDNN